MVVPTLLYGIGSTSFTYTVVTVVLEKYVQTFRKIAPDHALQIIMIDRSGGKPLEQLGGTDECYCN